MNFLKRLLGREDADDDSDDVVVTLDQDRRKDQLVRLEHGLDALAAEMRVEQSVDNPGWRGRVNEYSRLAGEAMMLRRSPLTREGVLDLVFEVRPVFSGEIPPGMHRLGPLQDEVMAAAADLQELLPGERA